MAKKIFILKTQSLVSKTNCTLCFDGDNEIVIPFPILDELEKFSSEYNEKAKNARKLLKYLSSFSVRDLLSKDGVRQKNGSVLRLAKECPEVPVNLSGLKTVDYKCLQIAMKLKQENKSQVILVTKNPVLRMKANSIGIKAQDFKDDVYPSLSEQYRGRIECTTSAKRIEEFYENGCIPYNAIHNYTQYSWMPNLFLTMKDPAGKSSALGRYDFASKSIIKLRHINVHPYGITPKNTGQKMILEAVLEGPDTAPLVIIKGSAGTGKTFQTLAAALEQTVKGNKVYSQILVSSPVQTVGQEKIGFLPGDIEDKFNPHLGGLTDNLKTLFAKNEKSSKMKLTTEYLFNKAHLEVQPIGFLRGRTILDTFYIIDETQNVDPDDIKSIVSRAGIGSKFVFLGDPSQIDNPNLNEQYNGLVYLSEKMKDNPLSWQVTLSDNETVRSPIAKIAAMIL